MIVGWELDLLPGSSLIEGKEVYLQNADNYVDVAKRVAEETRNTDKIVAVLRVGDGLSHAPVYMRLGALHALVGTPRGRGHYTVLTHGTAPNSPDLPRSFVLA